MLSKRKIAEVSSEVDRHAEKISGDLELLTLAVGMVGIGLLAVALALLVTGSAR